MTKNDANGSGEQPTLRRRKIESDAGDAQSDQHKERPVIKPVQENEKNMLLERGSYWLTRIVILRYMAFIYFVAFLVALHQNKQLVGLKGLLPAHKYMDKVATRTKGINSDTFSFVPSILWFFDYHNDLNQLLDYCAYGGLVLSGFVIILGASNWFIMFSLWILYHSIVNVGQRCLDLCVRVFQIFIFTIGWESQVLESGFLAIFLCPIWNLSQVPRHTPTSQIVLWAYRWLIFRIMLGAGLIKIRGDQCWRDLTCMNYHYETQPVPNPISYYMHQEPEFFHKFETMTNHFVELPAPFLLLLNRPLRMAGGLIQIVFQVVLIISGNLSFLNWLTILPNIACFDDASLACMFPNKRWSAKSKVQELQIQLKHSKESPRRGSYIRKVFNASLGFLIAYLSLPVVQNLFSSRQYMNTSFEPLRLVNTYGAFGSITKDRTEVIFQGTYDDPSDPNADWKEYEFKCKPGNIKRRPCLISPYHYRLDWLMWFAAFQNYQYNPWLVHLGAKLLTNDEGTTSLMAYNPFQNEDPPRFIRAEHYRYRYTKIGSREAKQGFWWTRSRIGSYLPPISAESIKDFMKQMDFDFHVPKWRRKKKV
ncbi:hypothetical protein ScPMuIL_000057 [Solemya velum]